MILDYFKLGFKNIKRRRMRSWLTMLGIFIGIAAVVALISIGQGLQVAVTQQFAQLGKDKIFIQPGAVAMGAPGTSSGTSKLTDHDIKIIQGVSGVNKVGGAILKIDQVKNGDALTYQYITGFSFDTQELIDEAQNYKIATGRNLKPGDKYKAVIGVGLANLKDFKRPLKVGDKIKVGKNQTEVIIVGILEKIGNPYDDGTVLLPLETAQEILGIKDQYDTITIQIKEGEDVNKVAEEIKTRLRKDRGLKEGEEDFRVQTSEQLLDSFNSIFGIIQAVFIGIAAISLVVGGIGIMNTMYTAVLERTREIGIMKAVGARNSNILTLFLIESGVLGLIGGIIGVVLGVLLGVGASFFAGQALGTNLLKAYFPWYLIVGALVFSFAVGCASGALPALQASKLKPVDALRYE
jgi:putative ABC transport system permease protein